MHCDGELERSLGGHLGIHDARGVHVDDLVLYQLILERIALLVGQRRGALAIEFALLSKHCVSSIGGPFAIQLCIEAQSPFGNTQTGPHS